MRRLSRLAKEIEAFCAAHADPKNVARYSRYFKEGYDAYGLDFGVLGTQNKALLKANDDLGLADFLDLGDLLFRSPKYEMGSFAILFAAHFREDITARAFQRIGKWFELGVRNWAHSDFFCGEITGWCLAYGVVGIQALDAWRRCSRPPGPTARCSTSSGR